MNGTKLADAAPELGTSTHLTTELFKQPACPRGAKRNTFALRALPLLTKADMRSRPLEAVKYTLRTQLVGPAALSENAECSLGSLPRSYGERHASSREGKRPS
jgi:hypothetical protein